MIFVSSSYLLLKKVLKNDSNLGFDILKTIKKFIIFLSVYNCRKSLQLQSKRLRISKTSFKITNLLSKLLVKIFKNL